MSTNKDITHKQGFTPADYFIVQDTNGTAIDLIANNWTAEIRVRGGSKSTAPLVDTFSTSNGKLELDIGVTGRINFNFDGTEFDAITIKGIEVSYRWDMQATDGVSSVKHDIYTGNWILTSNL